MALLDSLHWRYATKSYTAETIAQDKLDFILEAIRLAPSSSGLQPYTVFVIRDPALRARLRPLCYDQAQITQASHLLVFAAWDAYTTERINGFFEFSNDIRQLPGSVTDDYRLSLLDSFGAMSQAQQTAHAAKQCYIALGFGLLAAAEARIDASPMEGFDNQAVDELLQLPEQGLHSAVLLALGHRDSDNDWLVSMKKVRRDKAQLFIELP
ncbi:NAD(P)H-dependent oxidoreductase [Pseudomonas cremoricolorata]|uniref:NAD(P)H-dependent oxidoreductase n=1 Tax=Pseudomonas cremoricolorata TaxID=157783 RepID=UPI0004179548|nr:NAD(P)H-dependent oxidoreductase [Pseudomonas cremoricolorata]